MVPDLNSKIHKFNVNRFGEAGVLASYTAQGLALILRALSKRKTMGLVIRPVDHR